MARESCAWNWLIPRELRRCLETRKTAAFSPSTGGWHEELVGSAIGPDRDNRRDNLLGATA
jgi:hypothetical protein